MAYPDPDYNPDERERNPRIDEERRRAENEYPGSTRDRQGPGGEQEAENRRAREEQARRLNQELGIDGGNIESFLSGRVSYEEYLADQRARAASGGGGGGGGTDYGRTGGGGGGRSAMSSWLGSSEQSLLERMYGDTQRRNAEIAAREAEDRAKRDALYAQLQQRAQQSTQIDATDPIIKGQVDQFRAAQERARRDWISDLAEGGRTLGPTQQAMSFERGGQAVGSFQAELLARELGSRRAEISDALNSMRGMLSLDQQAGLQRELDNLDNQLAQVQAGIQGSLGFGQLGVQRELGMGGLENELMRAMLQNQQFYSDYGLRRDEQARTWDWRNRQNRWS